MSNEIATYSMILSKLSLGKSGTECPTKTQILAISEYITITNASSYGANECVKIDDINAAVEGWNYYLTVSPTSMSFTAKGGSKSFTISSYKRKTINGVEQSGDIDVTINSPTVTGEGFYISGTTVVAPANYSTSDITGIVTITQNESRKTATISLSQDGDTIRNYGPWFIAVTANPTSMLNSGGTSNIIATAVRTIYWVSGDTTEETGTPTLSTNLGSLSGDTSPSTLTLGENTSTSSRTATITASYSGEEATCTVTQSGTTPTPPPTPTVTYTFSVSPYKVNVGSSGGSGSVTITSFKSVDGTRYSLDYSIDSSTLPSWATFDKSTSTFTIQSTSSTTGRTAKVYFEQDESGKRDYAELTQTGYTPPTPVDTYVFTWHDGTTTDKDVSFEATGSSDEITLVSTKNGNKCSWTATSYPTWITVPSETDTVITIQASNNTGSARSGKVVLTQDGSGKTLTINVSQAAKPVADTYSLEIRKSDEEYSGKTSITFDNVPAKTTGWSGNYAIRSRKNGEVFDNISSSANVDWITIDGKAYTVSHNTTTSARSGTITLTQAESGLKCYININQKAYVPTYTMTVDPANLMVSYPGGSHNFTIISSKTVLNSDGSESSVDVAYTCDAKPDWVTLRYETDSDYKVVGIRVAQNTSIYDRSDDVTFIQNESGGLKFSVMVKQIGAVSYKLTLKSLTYDTGFLFPVTAHPVESDISYISFIAGASLTWEPSKGLAVNTKTVYPGDTINIYVRENNKYVLAKSFELLSENQTIAF